MTRHRRTLALLVGLLALGALLVGAYAAAQFRSATLGRPWFVAPSQLAVAADGTLVVGIGETEVQVYGPDGAPRSAWYRTEPGAFRLRVEPDHIEVVSESGAIEIRDADGAALGDERDPGAFERAGAPSREGVAADGTRYALRPQGLVAIENGAEGAVRVLVPSPPSPLAWFGARPLLPVMLTLIASLVGLIACIALARRPDAA